MVAPLLYFLERLAIRATSRFLLAHAQMKAGNAIIDKDKNGAKKLG